MAFQKNDGGRAAAGYKGQAGDCGCRALAIATGMSYNDAYNTINEYAHSERPRGGGKRSGARTGLKGRTMRRIMADLGWTWTPTMGIGTGCKVHVRADELPPGRLLLFMSRHFAVMVDGVLHDTYDSSRNGTRCVYGYWSKP